MIRRSAMPSVQIASSAGLLVGIHDLPEGPPAAGTIRAAVVCHPHPLQGGTMDNKVVFSLARVLRERGLHVVRFNFRGFGGSEGSHDQGRGERDDVRAALDLAESYVEGDADRSVQGSLLVAGFSFGSYVGLSAGLGDERVGAFLAVAPPVHHYDYPETGDFGVPLGVIYAAEDELVPPRRIEDWASRCPGVDVQRHCIEGATHLFHGCLGPLRHAAGEFMDHLNEAS